MTHQPPDGHLARLLATTAGFMDEIGEPEASLGFLRWELSLHRQGRSRETSTGSCRSRIARAEATARRARHDLAPNLSVLDLFVATLGIEHPNTSEEAGRTFFEASEAGRRDLAAHILEKYLAWMLDRDTESLDETQRRILARLQEMERRGDGG